MCFVSVMGDSFCMVLEAPSVPRSVSFDFAVDLGCVEHPSPIINNTTTASERLPYTCMLSDLLFGATDGRRPSRNGDPCCIWSRKTTHMVKGPGQSLNYYRRR